MTDYVVTIERVEFYARATVETACTVEVQAAGEREAIEKALSILDDLDLDRPESQHTDARAARKDST